LPTSHISVRATVSRSGSARAAHDRAHGRDPLGGGGARPLTAAAAPGGLGRAQRQERHVGAGLRGRAQAHPRERVPVPRAHRGEDLLARPFPADDAAVHEQVQARVGRAGAESLRDPGGGGEGLGERLVGHSQFSRAGSYCGRDGPYGS
jgi:hypothetical protein